MSFKKTYQYLVTDQYIDTKYHPKYDDDRSQLHEKIIDEYFINAKKSDLPHIIYMGGCYGSGKGHVLRHLNTNNKISLNNYIYVDPDQIRSYIPEYDKYLKENPWTTGEKTSREVGYICELIQMHALVNNYNIIIDGSLQNFEWYDISINNLKKQFPTYEFFCIFVHAPWVKVLERVIQRAEITKRCIPYALLKTTYTKCILAHASFKHKKTFHGILFILNELMPQICEKRFDENIINKFMLNL